MATGAAEGGPSAPSPPPHGASESEHLAAVPNLEALLSCSDSVFGAMDKQGKVLYASPTLTRVLNLLPSEVLGCAMHFCLRIALCALRFALTRCAARLAQAHRSGYDSSG
jgi:hypothetical protein